MTKSFHSVQSASLRWQLRRGMRELDVLFERYYVSHYADADARERAQFERLLAHEDPDIWRWVLEPDAVPEEFRDVLAALRRHA